MDWNGFWILDSGCWRCIAYFQNLGFTGESLNVIVNLFSLQILKKNDLVVEHGKVSRHIGFISNGMFQYFVMKDGEEKTSYISISNTWFASLRSLISEIAAQENIRALMNGSIYMISNAIRSHNTELYVVGICIFDSCKSYEHHIT
jgi:hypothetical protein